MVNDYNTAAPAGSSQHISREQAEMQNNTSNIQMINSKSTVSAVSQASRPNEEHDRHFDDGDMDMDNVVHVEEQAHSNTYNL